MRVRNPHRRLISAWDGHAFIDVIPGRTAEMPDKLAKQAIKRGQLEAVGAPKGKTKDEPKGEPEGEAK